MYSTKKQIVKLMPIDNGQSYPPPNQCLKIVMYCTETGLKKKKKSMLKRSYFGEKRLLTTWRRPHSLLDGFPLNTGCPSRALDRVAMNPG